jgi:hypothetical protein
LSKHPHCSHITLAHLKAAILVSFHGFYIQFAIQPGARDFLFHRSCRWGCTCAPDTTRYSPQPAHFVQFTGSICMPCYIYILEEASDVLTCSPCKQLVPMNLLACCRAARVGCKATKQRRKLTPQGTYALLPRIIRPIKATAA